MKKDRLDELLGHALAGKEDGRDVADAGLRRFKRKIAGEAVSGTMLDALLARALAPFEASLPESVTDDGLRRVRQRIYDHPVRRRSPVLAPALAFATVMVAIVALVIVQPFHRVSTQEPVPTIAQDTGRFSKVFNARKELIAKLPETVVSSQSMEAPPGAVVPAGNTLENRRLDSLNAFSNKMRGEMLAEKVTSNRRSIMASLMKSGQPILARDNDLKPEESKTLTPSKQEILLNDKLNKLGGN